MERNFSGCTLVFIGASGSGKGTQIKLLRKLFEENSTEEFRLFASGDILRNDPKIVEYLKGGGLVSDAVMKPYFNHFLDETSKDMNIIFDGFPRTMDQARYFDSRVCACERRVLPVLVVSLEISDECATRRMLEGVGRGVSNRPEDNPEAIKKRLAWFKEKTMPILDWFEKDSDYRVLRINSGELSIEEIHKEILKEIKKLY